MLTAVQSGHLFTISVILSANLIAIFYRLLQLIYCQNCFACSNSYIEVSFIYCVSLLHMQF